MNNAMQLAPLPLNSSPTPVPNIILFGETGVGKSSIVNMIAEQGLASTSSGATGCTFQSTQHRVDIMGTPFNIFDTAGLDEGDAGTVPKQDAIIQLYKLIDSLDAGVSLLIFCMRGPRIKDAAYKNWRFFHEIVCRRQVPIVVAITGLEQEPDPMDNWWYKNKGAFQRYGMHPSGFACITAIKGKRMRSGAYMLEEEYEESKQKMWRLIQATHLSTPWKMQKIEWFRQIVTTSYESRWCRSPKEHRDVQMIIGPGVRELVRRCDMTEAEARAIAERLS